MRPSLQIFTLDISIGEFVLTHPDVQLPSRGGIYSFNEANRVYWDPPLRSYVEDIQQGLGESGKRYSSRYIGSMVGDVHRTLLYGGIFGYPADAKNTNGKLRLLYEAAPMAYLIEQAGGLALTGKTRIMDLIPQNVHQRVPVILGSPDDVREVRAPPLHTSSTHLCLTSLTSATASSAAATTTSSRAAIRWATPTRRRRSARAASRG